MKRIIPLIITIVICIGVLAPITATVAGPQGIAISTQSAQAADSPYVAPDDASNHLDNCSTNLFSGIDGKCIVWLFYYVPFDLGEWAMGAAAKVFDTAASFTLSSRLYTASTFIQEGWGITRDFANIFFILILLFIALSLVLGIELGHANPKKMLGLVVVIALLINFSFFMTEVVIDISNSLALVFYNQVTVVSQTTGQTIDDGETAQLADAHSKYITEVKPLSIALARSFMPQVLTSASFYNKLAIANDTGFYSNSPNYSADNLSAKAAIPPASIMIPILIIIGLMYLVVAYSFIVAMISLMGRLIGLWIGIIFAPLAFVSFIIPSARHIPGMGWDEWIKTLMTNAFAAPIYFFFILLISILTKTSILPTDAQMVNMSPGIILTLVIIQFFLIITLLLKATSYVRAAAGEIGNVLFKAAGVVGGLALAGGGLVAGSAMGAVAASGQKSVGWVSSKIRDSAGVKKWASGQGSGKILGMNLGNFGTSVKQKLGRGVSDSTNKLAKSSFDIRHTALGTGLAAATGVSFGSFGSWAQKNTAGGFDGAVERQTKKDKEFMDRLGHNEKEQEALLKTSDDRKEAKEQKEGEIAVIKEEIKREPDPVKKDVLEQQLLDFTKELNEIKNGWPKNQLQPFTVADYNAGKLKRDGTAVKATDIGLIEAQYRAADIGKLKADGKPVTQEDVVNKKIRTEAMSMRELDKLAENQKANMARSFVAYQGTQSGYDTHTERDNLGNIKKVHVDTSKQGVRNWARAGFNVVGSTILGGAVGAPFGAMVTGAITGALVSGFRELLAEVAGKGVGSRLVNAKAAANNAHPHDEKHGGHDDHDKNHKDIGPFVKALKGIIGMFSGGGGAKKASGGGGGAHPHP